MRRKRLLFVLLNFEEIQRIAYLGLDRGRLSEELLEAARALGVSTEANAEEVLLDIIAMMDVLTKGAQKPAKVAEGDLIKPAKEEEQQLCPVFLLKKMNEVLNGSYFDALAEYCEYLHERAYHLPPEHWPAMMDLATKNEVVRNAVTPLVDQRALWLAKANPRWKKLSYFWSLTNTPWSKVEFDAWTKEERLMALQYLSFQNDDNWLEILEYALTDKLKKIRLEAARHLCAISVSALHQRARKYIIDYVALQFDQLIFKIKDKELDPELKMLWTSSSMKLKLKANDESRILHLASWVDPSVWEEALGNDLSKLVSIFLKQPNLLERETSLITSIVNYKNSEWGEEVLWFWSERNQLQSKKKLARKLIEALDEEHISAFTDELMSKQSGTVPENSLLHFLMMYGRFKWSDQLSRSFIRKFQERLNFVQEDTAHLWHYKQLMKVAAYRINPPLREQLQQGWPENTVFYQQWDIVVNKFLDVLEWREVLE